MYDYDEELYDNYNEFDSQIEELKDGLIKGVKKQFIDKLNELTEENARLQSIADRMDEIEREHQNKLRELENEKTKLAQKIRRERISELFAEQKAIMYRADYKMVPVDKCSECDKDRKIHFLSPQGIEVTAPCRCSKSNKVYFPRTEVAYEININRMENNRPNVWYVVENEGKNDEYFSNTNTYCEVTYKGEPFELLQGKYYHLYFDRLEDCQRYCDWLNNKQKVEG